jgi:membrane associated rhomboid family serine protease
MGLKQQILHTWTRFNILERLIAIMAIIFLVPYIINVLLSLFNQSLSNWFGFFMLSSDYVELIYKPWTLVTYGFFHHSFSHIFWNMVLLYISGKMMLNLFKKELFLNTFFIGVIAGGLIFILSFNIFPVFQGVNSVLIGSSAGVMAVLVFMASYMPNSPVRVFVFSVPIIYIALGFILLSYFLIPVSNPGGNLAHLGGAAWGYIYQRQYLKGNDIGAWFMGTFSKIKSLFSTASNPKKQRRKKRSSNTNAKSGVNQKKVDAILDKIADSGYESLTKEEKEYLFRAGRE